MHSVCDKPNHKIKENLPHSGGGGFKNCGTMYSLGCHFMAVERKKHAVPKGLE